MNDDLYKMHEKKTGKAFKSHAPKQARNKPVITISVRKKMTSKQSKTQSITQEFKITTVRSIESGISYIQNQRDVSNVYILRDHTNRMINSYSFLKNEWRPINMGGYFGGYRIGNPKPVCPCGAGMCNEQRHPTYDFNSHI